jgi:hypothetical protein
MYYDHCIVIVIIMQSFIVAHYRNILKVHETWNTRFSLQLLDKGHNFEIYIFGVMPLFNLEFCQSWFLIVVTFNR